MPSCFSNLGPLQNALISLAYVWSLRSKNPPPSTPSVDALTTAGASPGIRLSRRNRLAANRERLQRLLRVIGMRPVECWCAPGTPAPHPRSQRPLGVALVCRGALPAPTPAPPLSAGMGGIRPRLPAAPRAGDGSFEYAAGRARHAGRQHLRGADRRHQRDDVPPGAVPAHDGGLRVQPLRLRRG